MTILLFDKITKEWTGIDRQPRVNEVRVQIDNIDSLTKKIVVERTVPKYDESGNYLYVLPVPDTVETKKELQRKLVTEKTDTPAFTQHPVEVKSVDAEGSPITYRKEREYMGVKKTDRPVITMYKGEPVHRTNAKGQKLYYNIQEYGPEIQKHTIVYEEKQMVDEDGNPLYYKDVYYDKVTRTPNDPLHIQKDHKDWTQGLDIALETVSIEKKIPFTQDPTVFTLDDIIVYREDNLANKSFYSNAYIVRHATPYFSELKATTVGEVITVGAGGYFVTVPLHMNVATTNVDVMATIVEGKKVKVEVLDPVSEKFVDLWAFRADPTYQPTNKMVVKITNPSKEPIIIEQFALMY